MPTKQIYNAITVATAAAETAILASTVSYVYDQPNPFVGGEHQGAGQGVTVSGIIYLTSTGTSTTALVLKCHQGSGLAGPQVGPTLTIPVTAGVAFILPYEFVDTTRADAAGGLYTISIASTSLTVAGNVGYITMDVEGA